MWMFSPTSRLQDNAGMTPQLPFEHNSPGAPEPERSALSNYENNDHNHFGAPFGELCEFAAECVDFRGASGGTSRAFGQRQGSHTLSLPTV